ncbi:TolC family protein [Sulfurovum sp. CS9]|uniref:TolC family protein n=1 Tax=Sulfurovum sp. CS9 TaxID=3391146 RepID=UPI0039ED8864
MKILVILILPLFVFAQSHGLKTFINNANKTNGLIKAKEINIKAKKEQVEAAKSAYWPTVDIGGDYSLLSPNYLVSPGQVGNVYASVSMDLYDGGRKDALLRSRDFEHEASLFEKSAFEKSITLEIVRHYYGIQTLKATVNALKERSNELKAQINRVKKFRGAGLATVEDIDKLTAVYENNNFTLENTKLTLETSEENLQLISGISAKQLKKNYFKEPKNIRFEVFENIKMLQANANAVGENANAINAAYMPQVNISDTYHRSHFDDLVTAPGISGGEFLIDHQNKLMVSVNMRLFDNGKMAKESEAVKYQKLSLLSQIDHAKKEQRMNFKLAGQSLKTTRTKLKSSKSALKAARSTYDVIRQKFEVGLVDNIAFLDALAQRTLAYARYKETVYDYEIRKSIYYYYAGKSPKEFIR